MKKLYHFYGVLFFAYLIFLALVLLLLPGCGSAAQSAPVPDAELAPLFKELPEDDWTSYAEKNGEEAAVALLGELKAYAEENDLNAAEAERLFGAAKGLDGTVAAGYAELMGSVFNRDPCTFLRRFQSLNADTKKALLPFLVYITGEYEPERSEAWMEEEYNRLYDAWTTAELYMRTLEEADKVKNYEDPEIFTFDPYFAEDYTVLTTDFDLSRSAYCVRYLLSDGQHCGVYVDANNKVFGLLYD